MVLRQVQSDMLGVSRRCGNIHRFRWMKQSSSSRETLKSIKNRRSYFTQRTCTVMFRLLVIQGQGTNLSHSIIIVSSKKVCEQIYWSSSKQQRRWWILPIARLSPISLRWYQYTIVGYRRREKIDILVRTRTAIDRTRTNEPSLRFGTDQTLEYAVQAGFTSIISRSGVHGNALKQTVFGKDSIDFWDAGILYQDTRGRFVWRVFFLRVVVVVCCGIWKKFKAVR
jgi:hypothetical protein